MAGRLCQGYEYFSGSVDDAIAAVELAIVMVCRGDFSVLPRLKDVPKQYRERVKLARPRDAYRHYTPRYPEHVEAFWRHRRTCSATEIMRAVRERYGISVSRQTVYNQTVSPMTGDRKK